MTSNFLPRMSIHKPTYKKLSEEIINLLKLKKVDEIEKIINEIHPADIADILEILNEKDNDKLKEIIENTLLQLFTVYFDFARLTKEKKILKNTLDISVERLDRVKTKYKFGQSTSLEVSSAEVDKNTDSLNYLNIIKL